MGLQSEGVPDPADRHPAQSGAFRQFTRGPVGLPPRRTLQGLNHYALHLLVADLARRAWPRLVIQPFQTLLQKSRAPLDHHPARTPQLAGDSLIIQAVPT